MTRRLQNKVAIITGSSSGLGRAIATAYAQEGAKIVCADLRPAARVEIESERLIDTHDLVREDGGEAIFVRVDLSRSGEVEELIRQAVLRFGRIDILVNNAGISLEANGPPARVHETSDETWDTTMAVNEKNESNDRGWIINISSIFGLVGGRFNSSYAASKGAVSNLTRQVAMDYAEDGIHCNAICPGYTETAIFKNTVANLDDLGGIKARHPLHGIGHPKDIVGAAIFLASAEAHWITGVCLPVDGGYTAQ